MMCFKFNIYSVVFKCTFKPKRPVVVSGNNRNEYNSFMGKTNKTDPRYQNMQNPEEKLIEEFQYIKTMFQYSNSSGKKEGEARSPSF